MLFDPLTESVPITENELVFNDLYSSETPCTAFYLYKNASHENYRHFNFCSFFRS